MDNSINYQRRCAVSKAWEEERKHVLISRGSRNWSQKEQREILRTGKCHGYEGQHMLSVKLHPEHAGNENNIQFLTHNEHFKAHQGNWKNDTNGRYNLKTGKVEPFANGIPSIRYRKLSDPISDRSKAIANNRYLREQDNQITQSIKRETTQKDRTRLPVKKTEQLPEENKAERSRKLFNSKSAEGIQTLSSNHDFATSKTTSTGKTNNRGQGM